MKFSQLMHKLDEVEFPGKWGKKVLAVHKPEEIDDFGQDPENYEEPLEVENHVRGEMRTSQRDPMPTVVKEGLLKKVVVGAAVAGAVANKIKRSNAADDAEDERDDRLNEGLLKKVVVGAAVVGAIANKIKRSNAADDAEDERNDRLNDRLIARHDDDDDRLNEALLKKIAISAAKKVQQSNAADDAEDKLNESRRVASRRVNRTSQQVRELSEMLTSAKVELYRARLHEAVLNEEFPNTDPTHNSVKLCEKCGKKHSKDGKCICNPDEDSLDGA